MSDRIAVMNRGVIEQMDGPEAVYERPRTTFVAGFIGVSNLMPGEVERVDGDSAELRLDAGVTVRTESAGARPGERVHGVVRPEKLELHPVEEAAPAGDPAVEGLIESTLYLGTATQVVVRLRDGTAMTVLVPNSDEAVRRRIPDTGARTRLAWAREGIHMVREAEGDRLTASEETAEAA